MPTAAATLLLLLLLSFTLRPLSSTLTPQPRRILHQPLLPEDSPPSPPPAPSPPKYPFTASAPFFQSYPTPPPPPSPASFASFPANISSLTVSAPSKPNSTSSKLIIAAVSSVVAAIAVVSLAVFLHLRHRTSSPRSPHFDQSKPPNSDTSSVVSFNQAQAPNRRHIPKLHRPSQSSAEFLYLGTLVNSHAPAPAAATTANYSNAADSRKFDSPELRPLPPLSMRPVNSAEVISSKDDESEEFYSPKGSINGSIGNGSASRRTFAAVEEENFNGSTSNSSSTYSSSLPGSGSPAPSASFSLSPANTQIPTNSIPKSPDLTEIQTVAHWPPQMPSPPEARGSVIQESASPISSSPSASSVLDQKPESPARINSSNPAPSETRDLDPQSSPSPATSSSPEPSPRNSNAWDRSVESPARSNSAIEIATQLPLSSSPRNSNVSDQNLESPVRDNSLLEHTFPTPPEIRGLTVPDSASPLTLNSLSLERCPTMSAESSPINSNVSDQFEESSATESASEATPIFNVWYWNEDSPVRNAAEMISESALPLPSISLTPENCLMRSEESSPRNSDASDQIESPLRISSSELHNSTAIPTEMAALVLPESTSPLAEDSNLSSEESSPRISNISNQNVEPLVGITSPAMHNSNAIPASPEIEALVLPESASSLAFIPPSPARYLSSDESSPRNSNVSDPMGISSPKNHISGEIPTSSPAMEDVMLPESPSHSPSENHSGENDDTSPRISKASDQDVESPVASPARISSPEVHDLPPLSQEIHQKESEETLPTTLKDFGRNMESSPQYIPDVLPSAPPPVLPALAIPPPPPPPPPLPQSKAWLSPTTPTPVAAKNPLHPPALINPLQPIGFEASTSISPMQLPSDNDEDELNPKPKLKALHWDKVRASSDREMVWDHLKCSSFKLNEEMIETLFVVNTPKPNPNPNPSEASRWQVLPPPGHDSGDKVLDPKKSQNIAILLKALHVTVDEVCEGLLEGNAEILGAELLESLLKMAPSKEEERKLREYKDESPIKLGPAERFLKAVVDIPHAFRRVEALLYASNFESEVDYLIKSFATLEAACEELRTSRMFLKLLEAVLKTGNRMNVGTNRGDAHAFKLDTLLKLVDVKGADGKTTLLHFVVQEIIRSEGARLSGEVVVEELSASSDAKCRKLGLQVVSALGSELSSVKKAAVMDAEVLSTYVAKLAKGMRNVKEILELDESGNRFAESMNGFAKNAEEEICRIQAQESLALSLVKEITEYFHGNSAMEEPHPFRIFMVVRDFLTVLDRVCKEVGMINERTIISSAHRFPVPVNPMLQQATGTFQRRQHTSLDDENPPLNV
ncbi:hypothetical protein SASPL_135751 [Salvia splendens]|uniref:Formin-like protein n=1 Tax=Salvia splendens TaxID=180675 RepID=A0A8X8ZFS1_SALSN|nr:formin-like protein 1 [Salvia splendens]KAG6403527.1 hypothetical protein SASPL_135751 [Salvia splendens]